MRSDRQTCSSWRSSARERRVGQFNLAYRNLSASPEAARPFRLVCTCTVMSTNQPLKALVWPVATYGCESWTLRKNEETRLDAFEMKGLRKILRVSWTAKKTNEWVLNKAGVNRELLDTVEARKLAYYGHIMRKQRSCPKKEIVHGTMPGAHRRGRPRTAWRDNIKRWTGIPVSK